MGYDAVLCRYCGGRGCHRLYYGFAGGGEVMNNTINKAVAASVTQLVALAAAMGLDVSWLTPDVVMMVSAVVTPFLVWWVPNKVL